MKNKFKQLIATITIITAFTTQLIGQVITAPISNGATTQTKAPNGYGHKTLRSLYFIPETELSGFSDTVALNSLTFNLLNGRSSVHGSITGNIKIYIENTTDISNQKPVTFSDIITPMTLVYNGEYNIPVSDIPFTIITNFNSPFNYTGNGLYVAIDYLTNNPLPTTPPVQVATYKANNSITGSCLSTSSSDVNISNTLTTSSFRPEMVFNGTNLSIKPTEDNLNVIVTPNPAKYNIKIESFGYFIVSKIELFDSRGRIIREISANSEKNIEIPIYDLSKGTYFLKLYSDSKILNKKVIVY